MLLLTCGEKDGMRLLAHYDEENQAQALLDCERLTREENKTHHLWTLFGVCRPVVRVETNWESPNDAQHP